MTVEIEGVTLHLAHPDELPVRWVGQEELMRHLLAAWMVVIIVGRELVITGLRLLAASKNVVLAAERYGKHKTVWQIISLIALLVVDALNEWPQWLQQLFRSWSPTFAIIALWITVILTATSGLIYLWRNRALYLDDV